MKEIPPKLPDLFNYELNLNNKININNNKNETFGKLNNERIPIIFNNHLMANVNNKKKMNNNKYFKSLVAHRNNKKILTFIYYSPNPN